MIDMQYVKSARKFQERIDVFLCPCHLPFDALEFVMKILKLME